MGYHHSVGGRLLVVDFMAKAKMVGMVVLAAKAVLPVDLTGTMVVATVVVASPTRWLLWF